MKKEIFAIGFALMGLLKTSENFNVFLT